MSTNNKKENDLDAPFNPNWRSHPLDTIIETCIVKGKLVDFCTMASILEMDVFELRDFLAERTPIDEKIAMRLELLLGVDKQFWLNCQNNYDIRVTNVLPEYIPTDAGILAWIIENKWEWSTTIPGMWHNPNLDGHPYCEPKELTKRYHQYKIERDENAGNESAETDATHK